MKSREEILNAINKLEENIKAGERFEHEGYDTGGMLYFARQILNEYYDQLEKVDNAKDRGLAGAFY